MDRRRFEGLGKLKALGIGAIKGGLPNDPRKKRERKKYGTGIRLYVQRSMDQISIQKETHTQDQVSLIFNKVAKTIQWERIVFSTSVGEATGYTQEKYEVGPPHIKHKLIKSASQSYM